jgi:hypothetical protein
MCAEGEDPRKDWCGRCETGSGEAPSPKFASDAHVRNDIVTYGPLECSARQGMCGRPYLPTRLRQ